ncbi:MAG: hypothetical protein IPK99_03690 [Flavobacteriales bacterium]|nr:hypothetical protein [Flavobacteriales bacterium]
MDRRIVLAVACCATLFVSAQEKLKPLTLRDAVLKAGTDLAPERLPQLAWVKDAETYSFVKRDTLWENGVGKMMDQAAVTLTDLNRDLPDSAKLKGIPSDHMGKPDAFPLRAQQPHLHLGPRPPST